jgi:hypothetical protein
LGAQPENPNAASAGLNAATAGLLAPNCLSVQSLLTLAAITQPSLTATSQSPNPLHNNASTALCKFIFKQSFIIIKS